nr:hypothetical protein TetV2_00153 [Oceanusvirus sp.]
MSSSRDESMPHRLLQQCPVCKMLVASFCNQCETAQDVKAFRRRFKQYFQAVECSPFELPSFRLLVALVMTVKFIGVDDLCPVRAVLTSPEAVHTFGSGVSARVAFAECRALSRMISSGVERDSKTTNSVPAVATASRDTSLMCITNKQAP